MNTLDLMDPVKPRPHDNDVVLLPYGLLGFERVKNYSLLTHPDQGPFLWFQMLQEPSHAFLVVPPEVVVPDYAPDIENHDADFLELNDPSDAFILNMVTLRHGTGATVNLKGPIVINRQTWIGKQVIPANAARYPVRHPLPYS